MERNCITCFKKGTEQVVPHIVYNIGSKGYYYMCDSCKERLKDEVDLIFLKQGQTQLTREEIDFWCMNYDFDVKMQ